MKTIPLFTFIILMLSCSRQSSNLEKALVFAGENRPQLEKVLNHYKKDAGDGLKYKAAVFLIENMPRYYSYEGWQIDSIKAVLSEQVRKKHLYALSSLIVDKDQIDKWKDFSYHNCKKVFDSHVITADYLIENIELAFQVWERYTWNKHLPFEDFCELILPYRIGDEPLENWRKQYYEFYSHLLDSLYNGSDVIEACDIIAQILNNEQFVQTKDFSLPHLGAEYLFNNRVGYCRDACDHIIYTMRSIGIPVAMDSYIYSPENRLGHSWNVVRDTTGNFLLTGYYVFDNKRKTRDDGRKKGKIYRSCFGIQKESIKGVSADQSVPPILRNRYMKDVSSDYTGENSLEVDFDSTSDSYAFLSVFSIDGWIAVDISKAKQKKAVFKNVETNLIYQVLGLNKYGQLKESGYPFLFRKDGVHYFMPDMTNITEVSIKRKYPLRFYTVISLNENMIGATIWGSNDLFFQKKNLLYQITDSIFTNRNIITFDTPVGYEYIRYQSPPGKPVELAEFCIYDNLNAEIPLQTSFVNELMPVHPQREDFALSNLVDGDPLSFFISSDKSAYLTFHLGKRTNINKIMFVPRNDENFIWPGDQYELFFHTGIDGWKSLGVQTAENSELRYQAPENALLWLRNLTRGREEQIFYIKEGKQVFVSDIAD